MGASSRNAVLWRERIVLHLSLRILCAAAAREESFIQLVKESASVSPAQRCSDTCLYELQSMDRTHIDLCKKEKVNVSRLSQLLTDEERTW